MKIAIFSAKFENGEKAVDMFSSAGNEVVNYDMYNTPTAGLEYISEAAGYLSECECAYFCNDWKSGYVVKIVHKLAETFNVPIMYEKAARKPRKTKTEEN